MIVFKKFDGMSYEFLEKKPISMAKKSEDNSFILKKKKNWHMHTPIKAAALERSFDWDKKICQRRLEWQKHSFFHSFIYSLTYETLENIAKIMIKKETIVK